MNELIPLERLTPQPVAKELLALNEITWERGLTLTEEEARELSETRSRALKENDRVEFGAEVMRRIMDRFASSRYLDQSSWAETLNEITYYFYYIKAETEDRISDTALVEEMFTRFELYCRGDIDRFEGKEIERIIRKINMGRGYDVWYGDEDDSDPLTLGRLTPGNLLDDTADGYDGDAEEYAGGAADEIARDDEVDMDLFDDFADSGYEGYANEDDYSLYDEVVDEAAEEDSPDHPLSGLNGSSAVQSLKDSGYFSLNRLTGKGRRSEDDSASGGGSVQLPGGATLSVGDAYSDDFEGFTEDEDAFMASFLGDGEPDMDALDAILDRLSQSDGEKGGERSDE